MRRRLATLGIVVLSAFHPAVAQNKHSVTHTYDGTSPEIAPAGWATSDVIACVYGGTPAVIYPRSIFGLPSGGNIDAFSDGTDVFPPIGPGGGPPPANGCRRLAIQFSVDRTSIGHPVSVVSAEAGPGGNGAAGDVFESASPFIPPTVTKVADGMCTSPHPSQSNLLDLAWVERARYPVYFSIPAGTAMTVGGQTVMPADVLKIAQFGALPTFHMFGANVGLSAADDIDAIAVDGSGKVVFSLSRSSPTAQSIFNGGVNSAGLWIALTPGGGAIGPWATAANVGLMPNPPGGPAPDDLDGVRITDPALFSDALTASGSGGPDSLTLDLYEGSTPHRVYLTQFVPSTVNLTMGSPAFAFVVWAYVGIPSNGPAPACANDEWPVPIPGFTGGLSFIPPILGPSSQPTFTVWDSTAPGAMPPPWSIPGLPSGLIASLQGVVFDATGSPGARVTNMLTAIVE